MMCHNLASPFWVSGARTTELWAWNTAHVPLPPLEPGTSTPLPEAVGVFLVFWGALDRPQKDAILSSPAKAWAQLTALQTWAWQGLLRPSSSGSAQPGELLHFSHKSLHICGT